MSFDADETRQIRIKTSHLPRAVPPGSKCSVEEVSPYQLKFGDVIFVVDEDDLILQRFLELDEGKMVTTAENNGKLVAYDIPGRIGRVVEVVRPDGSSHNPSQASFWDRFTRFGTAFRGK
ncbi:MAG: hypothetical protein HY319_10900 [Armatimonadetes bacterium]|nr:hypothetical protein [Armatimonadota bacterium]